MAHTNDDMDRKGNRINTPQGGTLNKPTSSGPIERDREMNREEGFNLTNQDDQFRGSESQNRGTGKATAATSRDSETRGNEFDRNPTE